jgi:hypothetical protein
MKVFSLSSRRGIKITVLVLCVVGLVLLLLGRVLPHDLAGFNLSEIASEVGGFIIATVVVHWLFDMKAREELMSDIAQFTIGNAHVSNSGICDFVDDTKAIRYKDLIESSEDLMIALHYDPRLISDHQNLLAKRVQKRNVTTKIAIIKENGEAINFLRNVRKEADHIVPNIQKIRALIKKINVGAKSPIKIYEHDVVLRYSFVVGGGRIWLKFYRNSLGTHNVCGIQIRKSTPMYDFVKGDIDQLFAEATANG